PVARVDGAGRPAAADRRETDNDHAEGAAIARSDESPGEEGLRFELSRTRPVRGVHQKRTKPLVSSGPGPKTVIENLEHEHEKLQERRVGMRRSRVSHRLTSELRSRWWVTAHAGRVYPTCALLMPISDKPYCVIARESRQSSNHHR